MAENAPDFISNADFHPDSAPQAAPDFIPNDQMKAAPTAPDFIPNSDFVPDPEAPSKYSSIGQTLLAEEEAVERGLTAGGSDIYHTKIEPKLPIPEAFKRNAEDVVGRKEYLENEHPALNFLSDLAGTGALLFLTDGLGMAAKPGASLGVKILSNAAQGSVLSGGRSVSNDLAFGDPNISASKIISHAGTNMLLGGAFAGGTTALLGASGTGLKFLSDKIAAGAAPDLAIEPAALGWTDRIRLGLARAIKGDEALKDSAQKMANGFDALHKMTSMEDLGSLTGNPESAELKAFSQAKDSFMKEFGNSKGTSIDPEEILSYITNPASKNSTQQTIAFNTYLKAIQDLGSLDLTKSSVGSEIAAAQDALNNWTGELGYASQVNPYMDIEYGAPGETRPYSTHVDLPKGEEINPNFHEGITLEGGPGQVARVSSFGNPQMSPFESPIGFSLDEIQNNIKNYHLELEDLAQKQLNEKLIQSGLKTEVSQTKNLGNIATNLRNAGEGIAKERYKPGALAYILSSKLGPMGLKGLSLYSLVRTYGGEGGLYKLGGDIASAHRVIEGTANVIQKVDDKIGDKARLIFTGSSAQMRPKNDNNE